MSNTQLPATVTNRSERYTFVKSAIKAAFKAEKSFSGVIEADTELAGYTGTRPDKAQLKQAILADMQHMVGELDNARTSTEQKRCVDISLGHYVQEHYGFACDRKGSPESFYAAIGLQPSVVTISSLMAMPDFNENYRWLIPEVIREAVRLGIRKNPLYPNLIAAEENVKQPQVIMPYILMSDAMPTKTGEGETINTGTVAFGQKTVKLFKTSVGMKMTDEVMSYVAINILGMYMQDIGVKMNLANDVEAISVLTNGETGNNNAASVVGVQTPYVGYGDGTGVVYSDLLGMWISMGMLGRMPQSLLSNKTVAMKILQLPEFTNKLINLPGLETKNLALRTPVPANSNYDIHGAMPTTHQVMLVDNTAALIRLRSQALRVESQRIAERQITGTYVTETTGFAKMMQDASVIIDETLDFATYGLPTYMNALAVQTQGYRTRG
jgi:HK97 family phage major capsid protein